MVMVAKAIPRLCKHGRLEYSLRLTLVCVGTSAEGDALFKAVLLETAAKLVQVCASMSRSSRSGST